MRRLVSCLCAAALLVPPTLVPERPAFAQAQGDQSGDSQAYSPEQLDALLAPVALYPDPLLTPMLMATTQPLEVVQAARWVEEPAQRRAQGRCAGGRAAVAALGPEREGAGAVPRCAGDDEREARLDAAGSASPSPPSRAM